MKIWDEQNNKVEVFGEGHENLKKCQISCKQVLVLNSILSDRIEKAWYIC